MTDDNFEKARDEYADEWYFESGTYFKQGADWAKSYLQKSAVPEPMVAELVACIPAIEHAVTYIQYALEFDDTTKNTVDLEEKTLPKLREALTRYREWKKSNDL
jgi:hypothetical protein